MSVSGCDASGPATERGAAGAHRATAPSPASSAANAKKPLAPKHPPDPSARSAAAFVRAYYAAVNRDSRLGRGATVKRYGMRSCTICGVTSKFLDELLRKKVHTAGNLLLLMSVAASPPIDKYSTVAVKLVALANSELSRTGRVVHRWPQDKVFRGNMGVWYDPRYKIVDIEQVQP